MYEADGLPTGWLSALQTIDEVWLPSEWNSKAFVKDGVDPAKVRVVGEGIDSHNVFNPKQYTSLDARLEVLLPRERGTFVFLSVFKFETRKAWRELVSSFLAEFREDEPVTLLLRTSPGDNMLQWDEFMQELCASIPDFTCADTVTTARTVEAEIGQAKRRRARQRRPRRQLRLLPRMSPMQ
jgi:hypothetical protein